MGSMSNELNLEIETENSEIWILNFEKHRWMSETFILKWKHNSQFDFRNVWIFFVYSDLFTAYTPGHLKLPPIRSHKVKNWP
jgi:hypothetical protein